MSVGRSFGSNRSGSRILGTQSILRSSRSTRPNSLVPAGQRPAKRESRHAFQTSSGRLLSLYRGAQRGTWASVAAVREFVMPCGNWTFRSNELKQAPGVFSAPISTARVPGVDFGLACSQVGSSVSGGTRVALAASSTLGLTLVRMVKRIFFGALALVCCLALAAQRWFLGTPLDEPLRGAERRRRLFVLDAAFASLGLLIVARLYFLQSSEYRDWERRASRQHDTSLEVEGARGDILDSSGRTLVTSVETISVAVRPKKVTDPVRVANALARLLPLSSAEISDLVKTDKAFVWLARGLPLGSLPELTNLEELGIEPIREFHRSYPQGSLAASLLGRVSRDGVGQSGVEHRFDQELAADSTRVPVRRDARGAFVRVSESIPEGEVGQLFHVSNLISRLKASWMENSTETDPLDLRQQGQPTVLTIDSVMQGIVEAEFQRAHEETKATRVFGLVMDADTGDVLAMAQTPQFDPNQEDTITPESLKNFAIQNSFEPGSTFKPLVAALALDKGVVRMSDMIDCEQGSFQYAGKTIRDVHGSGVIPFYDVLVRSSNIGMSKIGSRLGRKDLAKGIQRFGFGRPAGIDLPGEASGIIRPESSWAEIDVATASFGQGVSVTALQLARAYAALANGGYLVNPRLTHDGTPAPERTRVITEKAASEVRRALQGVVEDEHGTGHNAQIPGVKVYGKTGTAQKSREKGRGYDPDKIFSSFVGFVDARELGLDRKLVMLVGVDEPKTAVRYGGVLAAPVFSRSLERIISHLLSTEGKVVRVDNPGTASRTGALGVS